MVKTVIVNVVSTANLQQKLDLHELEQFKEILHDTKTYRGRVAYFKIPTMEGKVSIFASGKMISVGTKSEPQARKELKLAARFLVDKGYAKPIGLSFRTQNMVITADFRKSLDLEKLSETARAIYEPEQFPGAIVHYEKPYRTSILVFASGKVVIAGLKSSTQIEPTMEKLKELIESNQ